MGRLALKTVLTSKNPKGRSEKPLREKVQALLLDDCTIDEGTRLQAYYYLVQNATKLRRENLPTVRQEELPKLVGSLLRQPGFVFPNKTLFSLWDFRTSCLLKERMPLKDLLYVARPWPEYSAPDCKCDPMSPRLCYLPAVSSELKVVYFRKVIFGLHLIPKVLEQRHAAVVARDAGIIAENFQAEADDPLDLEPCQSTACREIQDVCGMLTTVISMSVTADYRACLKLTSANRGLADQSITSSVVAAVMANPWLVDRLDMIEKKLPAILEQRPKLQSDEVPLKQVVLQ